MPVIKDQITALRRHIVPDHVSDRGAAHLDPGVSRSPTYQPCASIAVGCSLLQIDRICAPRSMDAVEPAVAH